MLEKKLMPPRQELTQIAIEQCPCDIALPREARSERMEPPTRLQRFASFYSRGSSLDHFGESSKGREE